MSLTWPWWTPRMGMYCMINQLSCDSHMTVYLGYLFHSKPCRIKYQFTEEGEKVRVSKRSGRIIPKAPELSERKDFISRSGYHGEQ